jgi:sensor c-di-GMP phosphodiesterase-like protein
MDDFGTGFELEQPAQLRVDNIKIDRSFIQASASEQCSAIVHVAGLGAGLDVTTTAEGVETADQLEWVRARSSRCRVLPGLPCRRRRSTA